MEEPQATLTTGNSSAPATSLGTRLTNVFVAPGEVFDEVKAGPQTPANWIVPTIIAILAGVIYTMVVFSQPGVLQNIQNAKDTQEKKIQDMVAAGKITQAAADQNTQMMERFTPAVMKAVFILGAVIINPVWLFLASGVVWLVGRYGLHGSFHYMKAVEVVGLAAMISVLGAIVSMLLAVIYADAAMKPNPVLFLGHFDPNNKVHVLLSALDVMTIWYIGVLSLGLARLSGASFRKAAVWLYGLWYGVWAVFALGLPALVEKLKH